MRVCISDKLPGDALAAGPWGRVGGLAEWVSEDGKSAAPRSWAQVTGLALFPPSEDRSCFDWGGDGSWQHLAACK